MTHSPRHLAVAAFLAALIVSPAYADDPWIGKRVVTIDGVMLMDGDKVVAESGRDHGSFFVYRVEKVDGTRLRLVAEKGAFSGWVPATNALTLDEAIDYFSRQIETDPTESKHPLDRAAIRMEKADFESAIGDLSDAIRLDPKNGTAYFLRGMAHYAKHDFKKAIDDYTEVIRLVPNDAPAYGNRGNARLLVGDDADGIADLNQALLLNPKLVFVYLNRGTVRVTKKEYDKGLADFSEAIRLDPKTIYAHLNRGLTYVEKKEYVKALADFNEAIVVDPKDAVAYQARAHLWATCPDKSFRNGRKAIESATKACELTDWKLPGMFRTLADAYAETGDYDKANEWLKKSNDLISFQEELGKVGVKPKPHEVKPPSPFGFLRPEVPEFLAH